MIVSSDWLDADFAQCIKISPRFRAVIFGDNKPVRTWETKDLSLCYCSASEVSFITTAVRRPSPNSNFKCIKICLDMHRYV